MKYSGILWWLFLGLVSGWLYLWVARRATAPHERRIVALALAGASFVYLVAACLFKAGATWILAEFAGTLVFGLFAAIGLRWMPGLLALGWALHPFWDISLHLLNPRDTFVPKPYPLGCISFDLAVAVYLFRKPTQIAVKAMRER